MCITPSCRLNVGHCRCGLSRLFLCVASGSAGELIHTDHAAIIGWVIVELEDAVHVGKEVEGGRGLHEP